MSVLASGSQHKGSNTMKQPGVIWSLGDFIHCFDTVAIVTWREPGP